MKNFLRITAALLLAAALLAGCSKREVVMTPGETPKDATAIDCQTRAVTKEDNVEFHLVDEGGAVAIFERTK